MHPSARSLHLWAKLLHATETQEDFAVTSCYRNEIIGFQLLRSGVIGVHQRYSIVYYNLKTLKKATDREPILGEYYRYVENDETIVLMGRNLFIIRKVLRSAQYAMQTIFACIKNFILKPDELYLVTMDDRIFVCDLLEEKLNCTLVMAMPANVKCLECVNGRLSVLTADDRIFIISNNRVISQFNLHDKCNALDMLRQYNLLNHPYWCNSAWYVEWDLKVVKIYGDMVFVGTRFGVLKIYHYPYVNNELNLDISKPIKQYEVHETPFSPQCHDKNQIIHIDIVEECDGHKVFVGTLEKIVVIKFSHKNHCTNQCIT
ncbi:uncharacterized protein LOC112045808 [Bicyclus anynana]|uniref:Uncharacterized protein LOC112045808 n=1 Tax=Bicyclus anynana TaxID=110368 RepID=A0ABM3M3S4_BICAN|nr:uncharacterized protein LOC112045808 [Bicyclus anynana]